jgi:hypothetical protein
MSRGALAALGVGLLGLGGCTLILDFSEPVRVSDAGPGDDAGAAIDAALPCDLDEPNDAIDEATPVTSDAVASALCPAGDVDVYGFTLDTPVDVVAVLTFDAADDLDLILVDADGNALTVSNGTGGEERIERSTALANLLPAGDYGVEVVAADDAGGVAGYTLDVAIGR